MFIEKETIDLFKFRFNRIILWKCSKLLFKISNLKIDEYTADDSIVYCMNI